MRIEGKLGWHHPPYTGYHFFGDEKNDYGYAQRSSDLSGWNASAFAGLVGKTRTLSAAKKLVEKAVRKRLAQRKKTVRGRRRSK